MNEKLTPERTVQLLRAKGAELEAAYLAAQDQGHTVIRLEVNDLRADIALIAQLLANHIERTNRIEERLLFLDAERQGMFEHLARLDEVIAHPMITLDPWKQGDPPGPGQPGDASDAT